MVEIGAPEMRVQRSKEDFAYFYTVIGFVVTIESTIFGMMTPFPWNVILFLVFAFFTVRLFVDNGRLQTWLLGFKIRHESKFR
jgi:hypothetical protein